MTPDPLQCLTCGAVVLGGSRFCGQCGADFRKAPPATSAPPADTRTIGASSIAALLFGVGSFYAAILAFPALGFGIYGFARWRGGANRLMAGTGIALGVIGFIRLATAFAGLAAAIEQGVPR